MRAAWPEAIVTDGRPADAGRVQAWVVGPGMGTDDAARSVLAEVLATDLPVVVDADALTLARRSEPALVRNRTAPTVLTPHDREFARFGAEVGADRIGAARRLAADLGCVVLLKGDATVVADADGPAFVNGTGTPWLATAGTGDVLAGILGALLATGLDAAEAAAVAAHLHGRTGQLAAERGPLRGRGPRPAAAGRGRPGARGPGAPPGRLGGVTNRTRPRRDRRRPRRDRRQHRGAAGAGRPPADGRGQGRRLRPRPGPGRAGGARRWRGLPRPSPSSRRRSPCGRPGITAPVLAWLHGPGTDFAAALAADVEVSVNADWGLAEVVAAAQATGRTARVHLKADTGLSRGGATPEDWPGAGRRGRPRAGRRRTSPSSACGATWPTPTPPRTPRSGPRSGCSRRRVAIARGAGLTDARRHLANSAATVALPDTWYDLVRPGIALYGLDPLGGDPAAHGLRPAMTVRAAVALTKRVPAGVGVSYGHTYFPERETTLALVPVGYADGVPRAAGNRAPVLAGGEQRTIAGRVCMDQFVLDVGDAPVAPGDEVVLWGPGDGASRRPSSGPTRSTPSTTSWSPGSAGASPAATSARPGRSDGPGRKPSRSRRRATPAGTPSGSSGRCSGSPRPVPPRASRSAASPRAASGRPSSGGKQLADAPRCGRTTRSVAPPGRPTGRRWCRPTTACCCRSRRSARGTRR